jgi:hypothetical protein
MDLSTLLDSFSSDGSSDGSSGGSADSGVGSTLDEVQNWAGFLGGVAAQAKATFSPAKSTYISNPTAPSAAASSAPNNSSFSSLAQNPLWVWIKAHPIITGLGLLLGVGGAVWAAKKIL